MDDFVALLMAAAAATAAVMLVRLTFLGLALAGADANWLALSGACQGLAALAAAALTYRSVVRPSAAA